MDAIFNMFKVRYTKLDELLTKYCKEISPESRVNLFINLEPIIRKLSAANVDEYLRVKTDEKSLEMISNIINLGAHYRRFFTNNKIYSKIYFYMGFPFKSIYKNRMFNSNYRTTYEHKFTKDPRTTVLKNTLEHSLQFVKVILEYVEGVYFIESDSIEPSLIPYVITKQTKDSSVNIILSTDKYEYQYANEGFYIIRPKKEESYMITKDNLMDIIKIEEKVSSEITVGSNFYPFILSLLGDKYRNIEKIRRVGLAGLLKMINAGIKQEVIGKDTYNQIVFSDILKEEYKALFRENYQCISLVSQFLMLNVRELYGVEKQLVDKFDNVALKKINDQYFKSYPIYLIELTDAVKLNKKPVSSDDIFLKNRRN